MSLDTTLKPYAIQGAAMLLTSFVGHQVWVDAKMFVKDAASTELTNEEKHAKVKHNLLTIFGDIGQSFLDVIIKLAVMWASAKLASHAVRIEQSN